MPKPLISAISAIAAIGENRELGKENKLLWNIPGELLRFKQITTGHVIIMGRKTYESIGRVLPHRTNIIITRDKEYIVNGAIIVDSLEKALATAQEKNNAEIFIIGGGQIFSQALPLIEKLYLTVIHASFIADTFFPEYTPYFKVVKREDHMSSQFSYSFITLERI